MDCGDVSTVPLESHDPWAKSLHSIMNEHKMIEMKCRDKRFVEELFQRHNYVLLIPYNANSDVKGFFESAYKVLGTHDPFEVTKNSSYGTLT
jgi:hypothetical protein